jgi:hypothetical protein
MKTALLVADILGLAKTLEGTIASRNGSAIQAPIPFNILRRGIFQLLLIVFSF